MLSLSIIFLFNEIVLFIWLSKTMKKLMVHYHQKYSKSFKNLLTCNIILFLVWVGYYLFFMFSKSNYWKILMVTKSNEYSSGEKLIFTTELIIDALTLFFYCLLNIRNVSFRTYVYKLLRGINRLDDFED